MAGKGVDATGKVVRRGGKAKKRSTRFGDNRKLLLQHRHSGKYKGTGIKGLAKSTRAFMATLYAIYLCAPFYLIQVAFWVLAMVGIGVEQGMISIARSVDANLLQQFMLWVASALIPEATFFFLGWIMSSLLGFMQIGITFWIYTKYRINSLKGSALGALGIAFAFTMLPLGIIPVVLYWMKKVYNNQ